MATASLLLKSGTKPITIGELRQIPCPPAEGRWRPVPHATVVDFAADALGQAGYAIQEQKLGVSIDGAKLFGTLVLQTPLATGVSMAVGIRSSFDKSISLQWCCGSEVFVCSNMAFSSSTVISRKHTVHGVVRYQEAICQAVKGLAEYREVESGRIAQLKSMMLTDDRADALILRAFEANILSPRSLPIAIAQLRHSSFEEFEEPNGWSIFNHITYAIGPRAQANPQAHAAATIKLGHLLTGQTSSETQNVLSA